MRERRFYVNFADVHATSLTLRDSESHHARHVLRLAVGTTVVCFDGLGRSWSGEIDSYGRDTAVVSRIEQLPDEPEIVPRLTLVQGILKADAMDWVVEKATELGVLRIVPLLADHMANRYLLEHRVERWQRLALAAAKQCERNRLPTIDAAKTLDDAIQSLDSPAVAFIERDGAPLREGFARLGKTERVALFIGPEGGWSVQEREAFEKGGIHGLDLGPRILRAETAAIAAITLASYALA